VRSTFLDKLFTPRGIAAALGAIIIIIIALIAPLVWGTAADTNSVADRLGGPSLAHPFGTDELGRDIFARVLVATRLSVLLALGATAIAVIGGVLLGTVATVLPRPLRRLVSALIDILLSFPWLLLTLFFSVIWGASAMGAMLAVGFAGVPTFARLTYTLASSLMGRDYVRAARILSVGPVGILTRHIAPNILPPLFVNAAVHASATLLSFAGLSFLGLGVQAPEYDWGRLLGLGIERIYANPMAAIGPGLALVFCGLVFTLIGETFNEGPRRRLLRVPGAQQRAKAARASSIVDHRAAVAAGKTTPVVDVRDLRVGFPDRTGQITGRVHGVSLTIMPGEIVGVVGESGSGKSVTAMAIAGLLGPEARTTAGSLTFDGIDMTATPTPDEQHTLGVELAMVFQDPLTSLNPALSIGLQLREVSEVHEGLTRAQADQRAREALEAVHVPLAVKRLRQFPHELSGGMRQRAMIGMGLMGTPRLLIADEPTTALDVTVQRQVLRVLHDAQRLTGSAILLISHDIALVSGFCDRILVMKDGHIVEQLDAAKLHEAVHPYTRGLIACVPDMTSDRTVPLPVIGASTPVPSAEEQPA
jgi:peptide/nickel transport system permease protein